MEHSKKPENQFLSAKNDLILVGLGAISLFLLNWQIQIKFMEIIAGITLVLVSGYGLSMLFFSRKNDISLLYRLIITPIFGIFLTGLWSIIINYTPYHNSHIYYELAVIPVLFLILIMRLVRFLKNRSFSNSRKKEQSKTIKSRADQRLNTAQIAAKAEKAKLLEIDEKNKKSDTYQTSTLLKESSGHPRPKSHSMPRPPKKSASKEVINNKTKSSKTKWAFKSHKTSKRDNCSPKNMEIIKIKNSSRDLLIVLSLAIISAIFIFLPAFKTSQIKIPFILLLIFFISGYSVLSGVFINFNRANLQKKIICSILVSLALIIGLEILINLLKLEIPSSYILATLLIISALMSITGYLRRINKNKRLKQGISSPTKSEFSKKSEINVFSVSRARESSENPFFQTNSEKHDAKPLKIKNNLKKSSEKSKVSAEELPNLSLHQNEKESEIANNDSEKISKPVLSPADARNRVISRKKEMENQHNNKNTNKKSFKTILSSISNSKKDKEKEDVSHIKKVKEKEILPEKTNQKKSRDNEKLNKNDKLKTEKYGEKYGKKNKPLTNSSQLKNITTNKKPLKTMYLEEELEKSFPSSDYFKKDVSNNSKNISFKSQDLTPKRSSVALDLLIILLITFLTIISIYVPIISETPLREISGLLFVLFIPGYVLTSALFPRKKDLENIERIALSFGLSLAISPLIGLALNYTPFGIKLTPIVVALTGFTLIMLIIAYMQRRKVAEEDRFQPNFSSYLYSLKKSFDKESKMDKVLSIVLILTLVLAIATTAYIIVKPKEGEKFTEFYILGPDGKASDYPTNLTLGQTGKIFVGVVNHEYSTVNYEVVVKLQGKILSSEKLTLKNNQKWEKAVAFTPDQSGSKQKLEFILYKLPDNTKPYRSLHLWVNVT